MKKENLLLIAAILVIGLLAGVLISRFFKAAEQPPSTQVAAPPVNYQQKIQMLEGLVAKDPGNHSAWVELGNTYYDSDQPKKAVDAYKKALELSPDDPDVLTDQGVMFRRLGWFDQAVENFTKANQLDPTHIQSLYNLGIVYRYDLKDLQKAKEAWSKYLKLNPSGPGADEVRKEIEAIDSLSGVPQGK
ncbi:MAG: tetratricopeptide repeat protein [Desulfuromonadales bacterium]